MNYQFNMIDAYYLLEIWFEEVEGRQQPQIRVLKQYGTNPILDELIGLSYICEYHSFDDNTFGLDGDMSASIEYNGKGGRHR